MDVAQITSVQNDNVFARNGAVMSLPGDYEHGREFLQHDLSGGEWRDAEFSESLAPPRRDRIQCGAIARLFGRRP